MGLEMVEIAMEVEEKFGVPLLDDDRLQRVSTFGNLVNLIVSMRLKASLQSDASSEQVETFLRHLLHTQYGIAESDICPKAELYRPPLNLG